MKIKTAFTTAISFYSLETTYVVGQGVTSAWTLIESSLSDTERVSVFFCEWVGSYGEMKLAAQAQGVSESARVRMPFVPAVYEKLRSVKVVIAKNADSSIIVDNVPDAANINAYRVWGGVDNLREENQYMEFNVSRYEVQ